MSFTLRFSKRSLADIERTLDYTLRQFGLSKYAEYKELIRQALSDIAADPTRAPAKLRPELHPQARTFPISRQSRSARHYFLYRIARDRFIDIGRLLHDSMDLRRHLPEGFGPEQPRE